MIPGTQKVQQIFHHVEQKQISINVTELEEADAEQQLEEVQRGLIEEIQKGICNNVAASQLDAIENN